VHKPSALRPGSKIGVVAPAGCVDEEALETGAAALRSKGFEVEFSPSTRARKGYLAGDAEARARDMVSLFRRSDIDAIFCARGGFGAIQTLPFLGGEIRNRPKIFAGYSDITVLLNWFLQKFEIVTFHAPMVAMDLANGLTARSEAQLWDTLTGKCKSWKVKLGEIIRPGRSESDMMGGCLSMLVTTLATPYEIDTRGKLLFLEDVGEKPYRIERMLTHLKMAGKLDGVAGVVLGDFTACEGDGPRDVREVVGEIFAAAPYPVVMGLTAGHGEENLTLPFGVKMALDGHNGTLALIEAPVA
jgi:muramoyltetrapeptide carboxypeptidase